MANFLSDHGLEYVGFVFLIVFGIYILLHFITWFYTFFIAKRLDVKKCGGDWALVGFSALGVTTILAF